MAIGAVSRPTSAWPSRTSTRAPAGAAISTSACPSGCVRYSTATSSPTTGGGITVAAEGGGVVSFRASCAGPLHAATQMSSRPTFLMWFLLTDLEDFAILHHEVDVLQRGDVLERVGGDGDQVGEPARLDRAHVAALAIRRLWRTERVEHCRGDAGGGVDGRHRRHPVPHHERQLLRLVLRPGIAAGIGAVSDAHAPPQRLRRSEERRVGKGERLLSAYEITV